MSMYLPHAAALFVGGLLLVGCGADARSSTAETASSSAVAAACPKLPANVTGEIQLAKCLATATPLAPPWQEDGEVKPVVVYIDRSGSMAGFLEPSFSGDSASYASVIYKVIVALSPQRAYGFGTKVERISTGLGVLSRPSFYTAGNTRLEAAIDSVRRDTAAARSHIIVGDGRRSSKSESETQYDSLRAAAVRWVANGGAFAVAASSAPFQPQPKGKGGCELTGPGAGHCPLYGFAFIAPGDEARIVAALARGFEHVYVWPLPSAPPASLQLQPKLPTTPLLLHPTWTSAANGTPIARLSAPQHVQQPVCVSITMTTLSSAVTDRAARAALRGQSIIEAVSVRAMDPAAPPWAQSSGAGALVRPDTDADLGLCLISLGPTGLPYLYRADLIASGVPNWLDAFDAPTFPSDSGTYGLRYLFESFKQQAQIDKPVVGRLYIVAN